MPLTEKVAGRRLPAMAAVAGLALVTTSTLSGALAVPAGRLVPTAALSAIPALAAVGLMATRVTIATVVLSIPATLLAAGVPAASLAPDRLRQLPAELVNGLPQALALGGRLADNAWALASVALLAGALWTAGATLGTSTLGRRNPEPPGLRAPLGFLLLVGPWLTAVSVRVPGTFAWQGAVVLVAGIVWFRAGRAALSLAVVAAVPATVLAGTVGPSSPWFGLAGHSLAKAPFRTLDTEPTYGPLADRRTGASMLIITAPAPALWRMQSLDYAGGRWIVDSDRLPELPQPAARRAEVRVRVVGLREDLAVAPGRIEWVGAHGAVAPASGEGMLLEPTPAAGTAYREQAEYVHPTTAQLSRDRAPLDAAARAYTRLGRSSDPGAQLRELRWLAPLAELLPAIRQPALDPRVVALTRRLTKGARTEWEIVMRVERYLLDGGRFRYTIHVPDPGPQPLVDFLLRSHAGYCQQFAGAAALLLRLAGVPARVVSGFATGRQVGTDRYVVRDLDAHEWIEVYFEGYGWVPFNPTPAGDPALIAGGIDPLRPSSDPARAPDSLYRDLTLIMLAAAAVLFRRRRRSAPASIDWLWRVARRAAGELGPSTTLTELRTLLDVRVGPRTAAIASRIERERFAADPPAGPVRPRVRMARALVGDLGLLGSLLFWVLPRHR